jgi:hypothetical protein
MKKFKVQFWVLSLAAVFAAGCGVYEPIGIIPDEIRDVRIEQFENKTSQTDISEDLTEEVINNFIKDGRLTVVSRSDADSRLKGAIVEYRKIPVSYDANFIVNEYRLVMVVNLWYYDLVNEVKLWEEVRRDPASGTGGIEARVRYYVGEEMGVTETEEEARQRLIKDAADRITRRTLHGWE